jgi:AcrR family transcriptional regulator
VLDAAVDAFGETGFERTTSLTIAERAGVTTATVYHHFDNKRALYLAAFQHSIDVAWREYRDLSVATGDSLAAEVMAVVRHAAHIMATHPAMTLLAIRSQTDLARAELNLDVVDATITGITARAIERGELDPADAGLIGPLVETFLWGVSIVGLSDDTLREACIQALDRVMRRTIVRTPLDTK